MSVDRLDESLDYLKRLLLFSTVKRDKEKESSGFWPAEPRSLGGLLETLPKTTDGGLSYPLPFLQRCARVMGYDSCEAKFDFEMKTNGVSIETALRNLRLQFKSGSDQFTHTSLSYGEQRLLSFFAMSDACVDIMVIDELVNGLHHDWIRACLEEIGDRQAFLTSQNPLLLDYLEFNSVEDVETGFILCERVNSPNQGTELIWRNPTKEEAREFFTAYELGLQRVSDILITKGFW